MDHKLPPSPADLGPEFHLLSLALRPQPSPQERTALANLIAANPDWPAIVAAARRHSGSSLMLRGLQTCGSAVPAEVLGGLRRQSVHSAARALAQVEAIGRLAGVFRQARIPMLALKGPVLSDQLYGDPFLRSSRDIDLIVAPENFRAAGDALAGEGYHRTDSRSMRQLEHIKDAEYVNPESYVRIELHHRLTDNQNLLPYDLNALLRNSDEVLVGGVPTATLNRAILPLYLCVHGASHGWERLMWLTDFAACVRAAGTAEPALAQAAAIGIRPLMLHALALSQVWLGLPLPQRDQQGPYRPARAERLIASWPRCLPARPGRPYPNRSPGNAAGATPGGFAFIRIC